MIKILALVLALAASGPTSDGEGTVYVRGDFATDFDVAAKVQLTTTGNKSWSSVQMMLLGIDAPSDVVAVGFTHGYPLPEFVQSFTSLISGGHRNDARKGYQRCAVSCVLELRGDQHRVFALINGNVINSWARSSLTFHRPYIQLDAEAHVVGDSVFAVWHSVGMSAGGKQLRISRCGFTSHGVKPHRMPSGDIFMTGQRSDGAPQEHWDIDHNKAC